MERKVPFGKVMLKLYEFIMCKYKLGFLNKLRARKVHFINRCVTQFELKFINLFFIPMLAFRGKFIDIWVTLVKLINCCNELWGSHLICLI